ncbi:hypothetical protein [Nostoc sp.]|uniref:hypothetical protein n=1 Tax=Nostoc sp. TaxID=1180 RepID=UPI002FFAFFF2
MLLPEALHFSCTLDLPSWCKAMSITLQQLGSNLLYTNRVTGVNDYKIKNCIYSCSQYSLVLRDSRRSHKQDNLSPDEKIGICKLPQSKEEYALKESPSSLPTQKCACEGWGKGKGERKPAAGKRGKGKRLLVRSLRERRRGKG